jgi:hypothetical protein
VAKPELGTKRLCAHCGAKFYDLNHSPIVCPKCGTVFEAVVVAPRGGRPEPARAPVREVETVRGGPTGVRRRCRRGRVVREGQTSRRAPFSLSCSPLSSRSGSFSASHASSSVSLSPD